MAKRKKFELIFEGNPLIITKLVDRQDASPLREVLLSNGRQIRLVATKEPHYPATYSVSIHTGKGARSFIMSPRVRIELTGLERGARALISVDTETEELIIDRTDGEH